MRVYMLSDMRSKKNCVYTRPPKQRGYAAHSRVVTVVRILVLEYISFVLVHMKKYSTTTKCTCIELPYEYLYSSTSFCTRTREKVLDYKSYPYMYFIRIKR